MRKDGPSQIFHMEPSFTVSKYEPEKEINNLEPLKQECVTLLLTLLPLLTTVSLS